MIIKNYLVAGAVVLAGALPAAAGDLQTFAYPSHENYCPAGSRPTVVGGVICCAQPNNHTPYHQAMYNGAPKVKKKQVHRVVRHTRRMVCPIGEKGCYYE